MAGITAISTLEVLFVFRMAFYNSRIEERVNDFPIKGYNQSFFFKKKRIVRKEKFSFYKFQRQMKESIFSILN